MEPAVHHTDRATTTRRTTVKHMHPKKNFGGTRGKNLGVGKPETPIITTRVIEALKQFSTTPGGSQVMALIAARATATSDDVNIRKCRGLETVLNNSLGMYFRSSWSNSADPFMKNNWGEETDGPLPVKRDLAAFHPNDNNPTIVDALTDITEWAVNSLKQFEILRLFAPGFEHVPVLLGGKFTCRISKHNLDVGLCFELYTEKICGVLLQDVLVPTTEGTTSGELIVEGKRLFLFLLLVFVLPLMYLFNFNRADRCSNFATEDVRFTWPFQRT